jgi:hypothetical protein
MSDTTINVEFEVGARVTRVAPAAASKGTVVAVIPHYMVRWDDDSRRIVVGTDLARVGPEVGDLFTGDDGPFIASLPDGTVVVNEDGNALLRCDGRWVDGWFERRLADRRRWSDGG